LKVIPPGPIAICIWGLVFLLCLAALLSAEAKAEPSPLVPQELQVTTPHRVRISQGVSRGLLIKKFAADYPAEARSNHVQGQVLMKAFISKTGDVEELFPISGDDLLNEVRDKRNQEVEI
jgi:hypothetical protein